MLEIVPIEEDGSTRYVLEKPLEFTPIERSQERAEILKKQLRSSRPKACIRISDMSIRLRDLFRCLALFAMSAAFFGSPFLLLFVGAVLEKMGW